MIDWLAQSYAAAPDCLAGGVPPSGLLNPLEESQLALLKTDKRRREGLLGRWLERNPALSSLPVFQAAVGLNRYRDIPGSFSGPVPIL